MTYVSRVVDNFVLYYEIQAVVPEGGKLPLIRINAEGLQDAMALHGPERAKQLLMDAVEAACMLAHVDTLTAQRRCSQPGVKHA